jgi:outer membrane receptor protein involved in Fe transport
MKKGLILIFSLIALLTRAQVPGGGNRGGQGMQNMNMGRFYGRVIDSISGKGVDAASVQLIQNRFDTVTKKRKDYVIGGQLTKGNGDFNIESLPVMGNFRIRISAIGYLAYERPVKFDTKMGGDFSQMLNNVDKDLGNIRMQLNSKELEEVKITGTKPFMQMGVDRRIFNVEKSLVSVGQTATELMKNIPGVNVDIDGNVTLRNASPTIFVDGRPTALTLDQIPADAIASVEIITNPSAKYDASGGTAGILNIVLKKNRKAGYNGNLRAGIDSRGKFNGGGDFNVKQDKVNFFASGMFNQRKSIGENESTRENLDANPHSFVYQSSNPVSEGFFAFGRAGMDYFINNRNTLTVSGNYVQGRFNNDDLLKTTTDSMTGVVRTNYSERTTQSLGQFRNMGGAIGYKKLFTKAGMELTSDLNYNASKNKNYNNLSTQNFDPNHSPTGKPFGQKQEGSGWNKNYTFQLDFVDPLSEKSKIEAGVRAAIRDVQNENLNYIQDPFTGELIPVYAINANFKYTDRVLAAYATYSNVIGKKFTYQVGLRVESSKYDGKLLTNDSAFSNSYPFSVFPSTFLTYKLSDSQDLQFSYARRINRPNFFQLMPFYDYTDTLNISRGNPGLVPEFTNSFELNYNKNFKKGYSILLSAYYKHTENLITRFQVKEPNPVTGKDMVVNTFVNANSSQAYGMEATAKTPLASWVDVTTNLNVYNSSINGQNLSAGLSNDIWSFFAKINANFKLPKNYSIQLSGDYRSRSILPQGGGGGGRGGMGGGPGGGFGGFTQTTAQGYINPTYGVDMAIRKEFMKDKRASLTLAVSDLFKTRVYSTHSVSEYFIQDINRRRDWQVVRLNFAWRFGKFDVSLFKRKNVRSGMEGMQEGSQMQQ